MFFTQSFNLKTFKMSLWATIIVVAVLGVSCSSSDSSTETTSTSVESSPTSTVAVSDSTTTSTVPLYEFDDVLAEVAPILEPLLVANPLHTTINIDSFEGQMTENVLVSGVDSSVAVLKNGEFLVNYLTVDGETYGQLQDGSWLVVTDHIEFSWEKYSLYNVFAETTHILLFTDEAEITSDSAIFRDDGSLKTWSITAFIPAVASIPGLLPSSEIVTGDTPQIRILWEYSTVEGDPTVLVDVYETEESFEDEFHGTATWHSADDVTIPTAPEEFSQVEDFSPEDFEQQFIPPENPEENVVAYLGWMERMLFADRINEIVDVSGGLVIVAENGDYVVAAYKLDSYGEYENACMVVAFNTIERIGFFGLTQDPCVPENMDLTRLVATSPDELTFFTSE